MNDGTATYCISKATWDKLSKEKKDFLKRYCGNILILSEEELKQYGNMMFVNVQSVEDAIEQLKPIPRIDPYYDEQRSYEREQMRNRMRYMNKYQRYPKK